MFLRLGRTPRSKGNSRLRSNQRSAAKLARCSSSQRRAQPFRIIFPCGHRDTRNGPRKRVLSAKISKHWESISRMSRSDLYCLLWHDGLPRRKLTKLCGYSLLVCALPDFWRSRRPVGYPILLPSHEIGAGRITRARGLREAMAAYVPADAQFREAFATARVSRPHLARYYLRALEKSLKKDPQPEYVANEDVTGINLEHVPPLSPGPG